MPGAAHITYSLLSVLAVSLVSLVGIFTLTLKQERIDQITHYLVSLAVGALFGDAIFHLIPESFQRSPQGMGPSMWILLGILSFFVLEKFLRWRHCHAPVSKGHLHPVVTLNLISESAHNFIDGVLIAGSFSISFSLGISTTLAILLHEIPQEMGDFGVLVRGGLSPKRALRFNFLSALAAFAGAALVLAIGKSYQEGPTFLIPFTAGGFLYIAGSDLIPELHQEVRLSTSILQFLLMVLGILVMAGLTFLG